MTSRCMPGELPDADIYHFLIDMSRSKTVFSTNMHQGFGRDRVESLCRGSLMLFLIFDENRGDNTH